MLPLSDHDTALLQAAIDFARPFHEEAEPGYFDDHVMAVVREVRKHTDNVLVIIGAVFHDLFEDTVCTMVMALQAGFAYSSVALAENVTDESGKNRKERKWKTYNKIRRSRYSILIKLCDRLDNLRRCMRDAQDRFGKMYADEDYSFRCALWDGDWVDVWDEYDSLLAIISRKNR